MTGGAEPLTARGEDVVHADGSVPGEVAEQLSRGARVEQVASAGAPDEHGRVHVLIHARVDVARVQGRDRQVVDVRRRDPEIGAVVGLEWTQGEEAPLSQVLP